MSFKPFRERNPVTIGALSLLTIAALLVAAFRADSLPLIGGGDKYSAYFTDSSGLKKNDEVRIAGVRVGKVKSIELVDGKVKVNFQLRTDSKFGRETGAQIKVKTLMGQMFLALEPAGAGQLDEGSTIPVSRTRSAYDVVEAFTGLAERVDQIDLDQLKDAMNAVATATSGTPAGLRTTLKGLSALSENVAARDRQLNALLVNLEGVSKVLADRDEDIIGLMQQSDVLMRALVARREAIHRLLVSSAQLSRELSLLVRESKADLKPALQNLKSVVDLLNRRRTDLDNSLRLMAPFYRVFANVLGSGPWFENWVSNLPPADGNASVEVIQ